MGEKKYGSKTHQDKTSKAVYKPRATIKNQIRISTVYILLWLSLLCTREPWLWTGEIRQMNAGSSLRGNKKRGKAERACFGALLHVGRVRKVRTKKDAWSLVG